MKEKLKHYAKEIISFIIIITILSNLISIYKSSDLSKEKLSNTNLELVSGYKFELDNSKPILIHFWASWCPTCKLEAQNIQTISENFQVLSIAIKSGSDYDIVEYLAENELNFYVHNDEQGLLSSKFNVVAYPTTFIYDKDGNLKFSEVGYTSTFGLWTRMLWSEL